MSGRIGILSEAQDADKESQRVLQSVQPAIEAEMGKELTVLHAVKVAKQIVAGVNFFIKAHVGNHEYIHVRIFQPASSQGGDNELRGVQIGKLREDALTYF